MAAVAGVLHGPAFRAYTGSDMCGAELGGAMKNVLAVATGAADGFNVMPPWLPGGFDLFAEQVVPILRKRGLFRHDYEGTTLRDHYGLTRPASLYSNAIQAIA